MIQEFDIEQLIGIAQVDPQAFEDCRRALIAAAVNASANPALAGELQSALCGLWGSSAGAGSASLRALLGRLNGDFQQRLARSRSYLQDRSPAVDQPGSAS